MGELFVRPDPPGPHPAVLLLPALGAPSVDDLDATAQHLVDVLAKRRIASLRMDVPPASRLEEVVATYRACLHALAGERDVARVFLFGHSLGGVLAPLVGKNAPLGGIAVFGAPSRPWCEALCDGARRQLALAGLPLEDVKREAACAARLYRMLLREGRALAETLAQQPDLAGCIAARDLEGETLFGAELGLLRELDALDLAAAWREVGAPVLAMRGEHDWIVALDDHERIAGWVAHGQACVVPGVDHDMQLHPSRRASFSHRGRGAQSDRVGQLLAQWIAMHA